MASSDRIRVPRGTVDLVGDALERVEAVERAARDVFARYGYSEIRGPLFEETRLFSRAIGETTDVVEKEMFTIPREGESYTLRPEGTASVVRHYVERSLFSAAPFQKLSYCGPFFRYERPQAARQRQFHQVGIEALGSDSPLLDAEVILVQDRFFRALGVTGQKVKLNTLGSGAERAGLRSGLLDLLRPDSEELCVNCNRRMERNVLRVLDCKTRGCRAVVRELPPLPELLSLESRERFEEVIGVLEGLGIECERDPTLVRGLDYYTHTVFETVHPELGARSAICGGGRYDGLVEELGGPHVPAVGFAVGVESTLAALAKLERDPPREESVPDFFAVAVDDSCRTAVLSMITGLRDSGLRGDADFEGRSLRSQMKKAGRTGARFALVVGPGELEKGTVMVKDLGAGEQSELRLDEVATRLQESR